MPEQAPFNSDQVLGLVEKTLLGLWTDLISHLPLLIGGLIILVLFFGLSKAAIFAGKRVMHGWNIRDGGDQDGPGRGRHRDPFPYRTLTFKQPLQVVSSEGGNTSG